ncbi:MAG: PEP/pyruvate-binding domain-containing protein, partial [Anaerolineaceae bacterium]|nr:PEP/pyruvate-binding domain-containing protein [Anaerolineaceae bacterium]
ISGRIRARMRREIFERGVVTPAEFESQVRALAIQTQEWEGLRNPFSEEPSEMWESRLARVRDQHTDYLFSQYLSFELFEQLVWEVLRERGISLREVALSVNPELAPLEMVFEQAMTIEKMVPGERAPLEARLKESKVVIIRTLISDQLGYINVAKEWFTTEDLADIRRRKIGTGRIGGKAAGMLLALRILKDRGRPELQETLVSPDSYFIGSDVFYTFMSINNLGRWNDQKYKTEDEMRADYPAIFHDFEVGQFPPDILDQLRDLLEQIGEKPLIVRSSSLLEDNFGTSFAGKYESVFCPNQSTPAQNLKDLTQAIIRVYASTLDPSALLYRRSKRLQDYDERMAILLQVVEGERFGKYYLPHGAGVAFSRNLYRWAPQIRREDGFVRLVWGLGTRAVDRVGNDFPRLIALSHPMLRPSTDPKLVKRYSQRYVDLIDLEENSLKTLPIAEVLNPSYPPLRYLAQVDQDGYFESLRSRILDGDTDRLVLTFEDLLRRTPFAERMRQVVSTLEVNYNSPVDLEFTLHLIGAEQAKPKLQITLLQCRPQSSLLPTEQVNLPVNLSPEDILISTRFVVPEGIIPSIDYVVYVPSEGYFSLPGQRERMELVRALGRLNTAMKDQRFICIGPGRWGSSNSDLGVPVNYTDIYNTKALIELAGVGVGEVPEPSLGTHFFQDLLEAQIFPLAIYLDDPSSVFNRAFFDQTPNRVEEWIQLEERLRNALRVVKVTDFRAGRHLRIVMSDEKSQAVGFLEENQ